MRIPDRQRRRARIEMLPLIDIVFLLLVFFIYAMLSMAVHRGMDLDLPRSSKAPRSGETPLSVSIRASGPGTDLFLDREPVSDAELADRLRQAVSAATTGPSVLLFADRHVEYQRLFAVLELIRETGIRQISLQARPR